MNEYEGHWIETFTGIKFHYLNPQPEEIQIIDIAHALSLICRFGGHCREFYSVAEHSVRVAELVPRPYRLLALLHDAHEAYLHDVPRPIKQDITGYKEIADRIQQRIERKFDAQPSSVPPYVSYYDQTVVREVIKLADNILLATEARDLDVDIQGWCELPEPLAEIIYPWTASDAEASFLTYFEVWRR